MSGTERKLNAFSKDQISAASSRLLGANDPTRLTAVRLIFGFCLVLVALVLYNTAMLSDMAQHASRQDTQARGRAAVESFLSSAEYPIEHRVCGRPQSSENLCGLLVGKTYDGFGYHDDLWIFFDASIAALDSESVIPQRKELNGLVADVVGASAGYGAWSTIRSADESVIVGIVATDLYKATLSQAAVCLEIAEDYGCSRGLPKPLSKAIYKLSKFLDEIAVPALPYEMANRKTSIAAVYNSTSD